MLRAAVVGFGWWGKQVAASMSTSDKVTLTHAVDPDADAIRDAAKSHGLEGMTDYSSALQNRDIDAVILTTPNRLHEEQVLAAAAAGKQIFCEKPLALTAASAHRMVEACKARGLVLGLGHERRFEPAMDELKTLQKDGFFGKMLHLECHWSHNLFAGFAAGSWRMDKSQSPAGALTTTGVHVIDLFMYFGGRVAQVFAYNGHRSDSYPGNDILCCQYVFENGMTGVITNLASTPFYCRFNLFGDKGWAESVEISNMDIPDPATLTTKADGEDTVVREFPPANIVRANIDEWADAVAGRATYRFSDEQKAHGAEIIETVLKSIESGKPETI